MRDHKECKRSFIRCSKTWYYDSRDNISVMVGMYHPEGGTSGEFEFEWTNISGKLTPQLKSYDDSWSALGQFKDLLEKMEEIDGEDIQEPEFCKILESLGIEDTTDYKKENTVVEKSNIRYFLFGGDAVSTYENEGVNAMVSNEKEYSISYQLYEFEEKEANISDLLLNFSGWDNYIELSKEKYEEIINLEK